jgi:two-component system phosphate regulon sensor histidine kinase PhoR
MLINVKRLINRCFSRYLYDMKFQKNTLLILLIGSSVALLLLLQLFWLQNSYEKAYFNLRRDTNLVFRNTLTNLRDSLFAKNLKPLPANADSIRSLEIFKGPHHDSMRVNIRSSTVRLFVNTTGDRDSIINVIRPLAGTFQHRVLDGGQSFVISLSADTVSIDTLNTLFNNELKKTGRAMKFLITKDHRPDEPEFLPRRAREFFVRDEKIQANVYSDSIYLDAVRMSPVAMYRAALFDVRGLVMREIAPQIFFSLFLTSITLIAFVILYKNLRAQQRLMEIKNNFISNITHELKTPVATVSVALEALKNFNVMSNTSLAAEYLDIAQKELDRLTLMTDKVLKTAVFENHGLVVAHEPVDFRKTLEQVTTSMKLLFDKMSASVTTQIKGEDFMVQGSQVHLTNVIYNLLDNAMKYSVTNPAIEMTLSTNGNDIEWTVRDHGVGIPKTYQKKIFEKFFRVPSGNIHTVKGYGLGLSYVAEVVKAHHGKIRVASEEGKGSTFTITLPKA